MFSTYSIVYSIKMSYLGVKKGDFVSAQSRIFKCCTTLRKSLSVASNLSTELRNAYHDRGFQTGNVRYFRFKDSGR